MHNGRVSYALSLQNCTSSSPDATLLRSLLILINGSSVLELAGCYSRSLQAAGITVHTDTKSIADFVLCMVLTKRTPAEAEEAMIDGIYRRARKGVVLGWTAHGERRSDQPIGRLEALGFTEDEVATASLRLRGSGPASDVLRVLRRDRTRRLPRVVVVRSLAPASHDPSLDSPSHAQHLQQTCRDLTNSTSALTVPRHAVGAAACAQMHVPNAADYAVCATFRRFISQRQQAPRWCGI